ncbi:MAG: hypothetical protein AAFU64_12225, partial [Bacteroidota bacterium]
AVPSAWLRGRVIVLRIQPPHSASHHCGVWPLRASPPRPGLEERSQNGRPFRDWVKNKPIA